MAFLYVLEIVLGKKLLFVLVFNNRLTFCWGACTLSSGYYINVTLPITMPNDTYIVVAMDRDTSATTSMRTSSTFLDAYNYKTTTRFRLVSERESMQSIGWIAM